MSELQFCRECIHENTNANDAPCVHCSALPTGELSLWESDKPTKVNKSKQLRPRSCYSCKHRDEPSFGKTCTECDHPSRPNWEQPEVDRCVCPHKTDCANHHKYPTCYEEYEDDVPCPQYHAMLDNDNR